LLLRIIWIVAVQIAKSAGKGKPGFGKGDPVNGVIVLGSGGGRWSRVGAPVCFRFQCFMEGAKKQGK